ncbi:MAG: hypothetical protein RL095_544 [Verrucomicrobiota bacterium]|jgi:hypothetical protein
MAAQEAYCVKCKAKKEMVDAKEVKMANGRPAMKGSCKTCKTGMYKILAAAKTAKKK